MHTPKTPIAIVCLATLLASCGPGLATLPRPSELDRAQAKAHRDKAVELLFKDGRVSDASQEISAALASDPVDGPTRLWAAWLAWLDWDTEQVFEHLLWAVRAKQPIAELAIWNAYRAFGTRSEGERLAAVLKDVIASQETLEHVRARALHFYGHTLRYLGRFEKAARIFARLGYLRDWQVIGPFDNDQNAGYETAFPPEREPIDLAKAYQGKLGEVRWRPVEHFAADGRISLRALLDPSRWATAYLVTWIKSPDQRQIALRLAAFRGVKLWINGRLLLADDEAHVGALDQYVVAGELEPGWNELLVKVCQRAGPWQLGLRLTDLEGKPLTGLAFDEKSHPHPDRSATKTRLPVPDSLEAWLKGQPEDPFHSVVRILWSLREGFYKRAMEQAVQMASAHPKSPLALMLLAQTHLKSDHEGSALKALSAVEKLVPGLPAALRERASYEQRHKRYERAMKILEPLSNAEPIRTGVRTRLITLLAARGWNTDALRKAEEFARLQPDRAWTWRTIGAQRSKLLQIDQSLGAWRKALSLRSDHKQTYDELVSRELLRGRPTRALAMARARSRVFPDQMSAALQEARLLLAANRYRAALDVCDRIERIAPSYWNVHKARGEILYRQGKREQAVAAYEKSLECAPDNPSLREYLDFLIHRPDKAFERYRMPDAAVDEVLADRTAPGDHPEAEALFLLDDHVTHVFQDGSAKHLVRQVYRVLNENGQRRFTKFRVPASSSFRLEVAETIQPDGSRQEATSIRRGVIHFPSLRPGSILHVAYRYDSASSSWMEDHFAMDFFFQGSNPVGRARWVLVLPDGKDLKVLKRGDEIQYKKEKLDSETAHIWTASQVPMLHQESFQPPLRDIRAAVYVSTVSSWEVLARWQNSLIQDQFEIDDEVRTKTEELIRDSKTPMDRLEAVYRFVAKEVRYLNHDVGIFGKKPNMAVNVFENRFGDCKDKATLMIAMLKHVGIEAHYAAVRTRDRGEVIWEVPYAQTNHIITFIPKQAGIEQDLFVDGTSQFGNVHYLSERNQGIKAFVLDGERHQVIDTPMLPAEATSAHSEMRASLAGTEDLQIHSRDSWTGYFATRNRSALHTAGKREEEFSKRINYRFPGARLTKVNFLGLDALDEQAGAEYDLIVPGQVRREGDTLRLKLLPLSNLTARMARKPTRRYEIFNMLKLTSRVRSTLAVPKDYRVKNLPSPLTIENDRLRYRYECLSEKGEVVCSRTFQMKSRHIPRQEYQEFRKHCMQVDRAEEQDIVLAPAAP